jgi:hypothetical protein
MSHKKETYTLYKINKACDRIENRIRKHPPHVTGWLSKGINKERMQAIAKEWEENYGRKAP